ncbi:MAG: SDR family oxidoreductase [Ramlibacter sp.]|nr:SDR family oxidoreductase [Ramlibacter sp.]
MPSNQNPLGALPARFRRERLLVVGCGDVGLRVVGALGGRLRVLALTSSPSRVPALRARGVQPVVGDLDAPASLRRLAGVATRVLHLAPPPSDGQPQWWRDPRTQALLRALRLRSTPAAVVYGSTSGVYGDCQGEVAMETRAPNAHTPRAQRRLDAETLVRHYGRTAGAGGAVRACILRIPGIYAPDREGGTPQARLLKGTPVLAAQDDVFTNHIHADDLARACLAALWRGRPQRVYNVNDDTQLKMGDYFDLAADLFGLPRPPRVPRSTAQDALPLSLLSFMSESRRMDNSRLKRELGVKLKYASAEIGLQISK